MRRAALLGAALLAACAIGGDPPPADTPPSSGAAGQAETLAGLAERVCLAAQAARRSLPAFVARGGPARLGLRPAPPPDSGWVTASGPRAFVGERQGTCFAYAVPPEPGAAAALVSILARPVGSRLAAEPRAADGALVRRICRGETSLTVIEGEGPDGRPLLGIGVPPRPAPCDPLSPPVPGRPGGA